MSLPLNPETLQNAYEYLRTTPPFKRWNMPEGEDITFRVTRARDHQGRYYRHNGKHVLEVSGYWIGRTHSLLEVMAHEMIHVHQGEVGMETQAQHNAAFRKLAERVCKIHGFDPKLF